MENLELQLDLGLRSIKANEFGDVITINVADATTAQRFANIIKNLEHTVSDFDGEIKALEKKYKNAKPDESGINADQIIDSSKLAIQLVEKCIEEIEGVFGKDCIKKAYRACYENDACYVPSQDALLEFIYAITPVMEQLFNERFETNKKKYNPERRGSHNKSKQQLIDEFKEKSVENE